MAKRHHPKRGSMAYSPRKRAKSHIPRFRSWPEIDEDKPRLLGFAGYKAGMTHVIAVDPADKKNKPTGGMEIHVPVTVVEVPPLKVAGIRFYVRDYWGLRPLTEIWASPKQLGKYMDRDHPIPKKENKERIEEKWKMVENAEIEDVRIIAATQPHLISGVPKKKPDLMEIKIGGGTIAERIEYAKNLLGKEVGIEDFAVDGKVIDVAAVTKGHGFQGPVKRWGIKLLSHKDSKGRRKVGAEGSFNPHITPRTVPQAGQMGYHHRVEFNKIIMKIGKDGKEITPKGGFLHYGIVRNPYILIKGSVPGPAKRMIGLRDPIRNHGEAVRGMEITYISTESKQGV